MNVGGLIEGSIRGYHLSNKRGPIPHLTTISRLCIFAGVRGLWDEEEICPKVSPLTLTRVTKGPRNKKQKGMVEVEAERRMAIGKWKPFQSKFLQQKRKRCLSG